MNNLESTNSVLEKENLKENPDFLEKLKGKIQSIISKLLGRVLENLEEYKEFGKPNKRDIKILEEIEKEEPSLFEKLKGKIEFREETIVIEGLEIDREDLVVDLKNKMDWNTSMEESKRLGKKIISKEESEKLFNLFNGKEEYIWLVLDTASSGYWTSATDANDTSSAWVVDFGYGCDGRDDKIDNHYARCVR